MAARRHPGRPLPRRTADAPEQALHARQPERDASLIPPPDHGSQDVSIRYPGRRAEAGIEPSVGSTGDSCDNALAETINGLDQAELIHRRPPRKMGESLELATLEWGTWFNPQRLLEPLGYIPPAEAEDRYPLQLTVQAKHVCTQTTGPLRNSGRFKITGGKVMSGTGAAACRGRLAHQPVGTGRLLQADGRTWTSPRR